MGSRVEPRSVRMVSTAAVVDGLRATTDEYPACGVRGVIGDELRRAQRHVGRPAAQGIRALLPRLSRLCAVPGGRHRRMLRRAGETLQSQWEAEGAPRGQQLQSAHNVRLWAPHRRRDGKRPLGLFGIREGHLVERANGDIVDFKHRREAELVPVARRGATTQRHPLADAPHGDCLAASRPDQARSRCPQRVERMAPRRWIEPTGWPSIRLAIHHDLCLRIVGGSRVTVANLDRQDHGARRGPPDRHRDRGLLDERQVGLGYRHLVVV